MWKANRKTGIITQRAHFSLFLARKLVVHKGVAEKILRVNKVAQKGTFCGHPTSLPTTRTSTHSNKALQIEQWHQEVKTLIFFLFHILS